MFKINDILLLNNCNDILRHNYRYSEPDIEQWNLRWGGKAWKVTEIIFEDCCTLLLHNKKVEKWYGDNTIHEFFQKIK